MTAMPEPTATETDAAYRARLRAWFEEIPRSPDDTPGLIAAEWEYLCSLQGIDPA